MNVKHRKLGLTKFAMSWKETRLVFCQRQIAFHKKQALRRDTWYGLRCENSPVDDERRNLNLALCLNLAVELSRC